MYTKALLSVFKGRLYDPSGRAGAISRCEVSVQDRAEETQCRFIIKMVCNQGVIKTYKLTYEAVDVMHALFDRNVANNRWSIQPGIMKEYIEHFGTKTEMLDIFAGDDRRAVFKSYTEKISNGREVLRHPLVTAIAVSTSDFDEFNVQPGLHIIISVKDFKAIVIHADTLKARLKAFYSLPTRPLQFSYGAEGLACEFTLMTSGDYNSAIAIPTPAPQLYSRANSRAQSTRTNDSRSMPPPMEPASRRSTRIRPGSANKTASPKTQSDPDLESLFVGQDDDDEARWEPADYSNEEDMLGWDASANQDAANFPIFRNTGSFSRADDAGTGAEERMEGIAASQTVSQVQGLW